MKIIHRIILLILYVVPFSLVVAQAEETDNISILPMEGWVGSSSDARAFQNALTDKITTRIIQSHRFNVIDRGNLESLLREQDLQLTGLIDAASISAAGKIIGVQMFLVGRFSRNSTEYTDPIRSEGKVIAKGFYTAELHSSLRLLSVESARYVEAVEAVGKGKGPDKYNAYLNAVDKLAKNIIAGFDRYFSIQASIISMNKSVVELDRGSSFGVKVGMNFAVFNSQPGWDPNEIKGDEVGLLRITSVQSGKSTGRLMGTYEHVSIGDIVRESKVATAITAKILKRTGSKVVLNVGADLGVKKKDVYTVIATGDQIVDQTSGEVYGSESSEVGSVVITKVAPAFSEAIIIKGPFRIKELMGVKESKMVPVTIGIGATFAPLSAPLGNMLPDTMRVSDPYSGDFEFPIDSTDYSTEQSVSVAQIVIYKRDLGSGLTYSIGYDQYSFSNTLEASMGYGTIGYHYAIIPDYLYIYPSIGIGAGSTRQTLPGSIISDLSDGESEVLVNSAFPVIAQVGVRGKLGRFLLNIDATYKVWMADSWEYATLTGEKTEGGADKKEFISFDRDNIIYPEVDLGGFYIRAGLSFEIN